MSWVRKGLLLFFGGLFAACLASPWLSNPLSLRLCSAILLGVGWLLMSILAVVASFETVECQDQPYFAGACWSVWAAVTVALFGPSFHIAAWSLTAVVVGGWTLAAVGLWLECRRYSSHSDRLLSSRQVAETVYSELCRKGGE